MCFYWLNCMSRKPGTKPFIICKKKESRKRFATGRNRKTFISCLVKYLTRWLDKKGEKGGLLRPEIILSHHTCSLINANGFWLASGLITRLYFLPMKPFMAVPVWPAYQIWPIALLAIHMFHVEVACQWSINTFFVMWFKKELI